MRDYQRLLDLQIKLSEKIDLKTPPVFNPNFFVVCDAAYLGDSLCMGVAALFSFENQKEPIEIKVSKRKTKLPYIPGLLSFRESPAILASIKKIAGRYDLIFVDGQGIAHPRKMGIATYIGLLINKPTIGIAKNCLVGEYENPENFTKSYKPLYYNQTQVGWVVRFKENTKPLFVSPGNLISIEDSLRFSLCLLTKYRIPEPLRLTDILAKKFKKGL